MFIIIVSALYFILPAYVANMAPVIAGSLRLPYAQPIHVDLLGSNKTWRGVYSAWIGACVALVLQHILQTFGYAEQMRILDYSSLKDIFFLSILFSIGAMLGDAIKSFCKRRVGIRPGRPWFPFDQLDFIIGALLCVYPFYWYPLAFVPILCLFTPLLHFLVNCTAYILKLKKVWW